MLPGLNSSSFDGNEEQRLASIRDMARRSVRRYKEVAYKVSTLVADSKLCTSFNEYVNRFGPVDPVPGQEFDGTPIPFSTDNELNLGHRALTHGVYGFFKNGGTRCFVARVNACDGDQIDRALRDFESIDAIAIVAAPGVLDKEGSPKLVWQKLVEHCEATKDRFAILDSPEKVEDKGEIDVKILNYDKIAGRQLPDRSKNAAYYFPWIEVNDPAQQMQDEDPASKTPRPIKHRGQVVVPPSGHVAGIYARTDEQRGVHKAPANAPVLGAQDVKYYVSKRHQALLNPQGVNCIRNLNGNITVYGGAHHRRRYERRMEVRERAPPVCCSSRSRSTKARSGWFLSPTIWRCGVRFGATSPPS